MHDALRAENLVPAEVNMEMHRTCGLMWTLWCSFVNFGANTDIAPFADMARDF